MIVVRLLGWVFRIKSLPTPDYKSLRVPTFGEAITGVSRT